MTLRFPSDATVNLENITLRSAFFPLLSKHLVIDYFHAEIAEYAFFQSTEAAPSLEVDWDGIQERVQKKSSSSPRLSIYLSDTLKSPMFTLII